MVPAAGISSVAGAGRAPLSQAWFNGKAEVYVSDGLFAKFAGDLRQELADDGIIAYGWSMTALQGNSTGGLDQDCQYTNLTNFGLDFDKLADIEGLSARVHVRQGFDA